MATHIDERGDRVSEAETHKTVEATAVQARQGPRGQRVLMILLAALVLAGIGWAVAESYGESTDNDAATDVKQQQQPAATLQIPNADQPTTDNTPVNGATMQKAPTEAVPSQQP